MAWRLNLALGGLIGVAVILLFAVWETQAVGTYSTALGRYISHGLGLDSLSTILSGILDSAVHQMRTSTYLATLLGALVASRPAAAKLDITSETTLDCGAGPNDLTAGYLDLDTGSMFFTLFHAKEAARDKGLVIYFGGGPGASSWDYGLIGE